MELLEKQNSYVINVPTANGATQQRICKIALDDGVVNPILTKKQKVVANKNNGKITISKKSARTEGAEAVSLATGDTARSVRHWYSFSWGRGRFRRDRLPKSVRDCGNLHILQIGTKSPECAVSIRRGRSIGPTWGQLRPNLAPSWPNFGPIWEQLRPKLKSIYV